MQVLHMDIRIVVFDFIPVDDMTELNSIYIIAIVIIYRQNRWLTRRTMRKYFPILRVPQALFHHNPSQSDMNAIVLQNCG